MSSRNVNMLEGSPTRLLITFSLPMLIGNIFQQFYNLVDSVVVGRMIGEDALAAIGATNSATFLFFALCNGIGTGGGIIVSQLYGGRDYKNLRKCMINTAFLMTVLPFIVGTIAFALAEPLLIVLKTPPEVLSDSLTYMRIMCVGIIFVSMYNYASSMLRALGDSKTPLYFLIFSCIINTILDILLVSRGFGIRGAAYATLISQLISGFSCLLYAYKKNEFFTFKREDLVLDRGLIGKIVKLGLPLSLQYSMIAISCMALQSVVNSFGKTAMATFTATGRIESIIHQPYQTLAAALSTYTGQNYGARKYDRVYKGYHRGLTIMLIFTLAMVPIMQFFGDNIMSIFVSDMKVISLGKKALCTTSLFYLFLGSLYVIRGVLNGLGDGSFALINGIVEMIGRLTVPFLLTGYVGVMGIWWSTGVVWFVAAATALLRYLRYSRRTIGEYKRQRT